MSDPVVIVEGLGKRYRIGAPEKAQSARNPFRRLARAFGARSGEETLWALRDASFAVGRGEVLGIIGRNGAGKSTLLKILTRITEPTEGRAELHGRVGSLLEVGTGFHPDLTGRENIYLNGAILGMHRGEIARKFDEIVSFAEVERFIDTPVKYYSSGMYVRLAFAVAAHLETEILLVDEVLAVGDIHFRRKCLGKMRDVTTAGRTALFVSHDMTQVRQLCGSAIWIDAGGVRAQGQSEAVCAEYESRGMPRADSGNPVVRKEYFKSKYPGPQIERVELRASDGPLRNEFEYGDSFDLILTLRADSPRTEKEFSASWFLHNEQGTQLAAGASFPMDAVTFSPADRVLACRVGPLSLPTGRYSLRCVLHVPHYDNFDDWPDAISFRVARCDPFRTGYDYPGIYSALLFVPHRWRRIERKG